MEQTCPNCNNEIDQGSAYCKLCGTSVAQQSTTQLICPKCGKRFPLGTKFCDADGFALYNQMNGNSAAYAFKTDNNRNVSATMLLVFVAIVAFCELFGLIINTVTEGQFFFTYWKYVFYIFSIIEYLSFFLIPVAIKKQPLKTIAFVLITLINFIITIKHISLLIST